MEFRWLGTVSPVFRHEDVPKIVSVEAYTSNKLSMRLIKSEFVASNRLSEIVIASCFTFALITLLY